MMNCRDTSMKIVWVMQNCIGVCTEEPLSMSNIGIVFSYGAGIIGLKTTMTPPSSVLKTCVNCTSDLRSISKMRPMKRTGRIKPKSRVLPTLYCAASICSAIPTGRKNSSRWCAASAILWSYCRSTSTNNTTSKPVPTA